MQGASSDRIHIWKTSVRTQSRSTVCTLVLTRTRCVLSAASPMCSLDIMSCRELSPGVAGSCISSTSCIRRKLLGKPHSPSKQDRSMRLRASQEKASEFIRDLKDGITRKSTMETTALAKELLQTDKIGSRGEFYVAAQFLFIAFVVIPPVDLKPVSQVIGAGALLIGVAIIIAGSNNLGRNLTPLPVPREDATLTTDGMFKWMRHPLYTGLMLFSVGIAAVSQDSTRALFAAALVVALSFKAEFEERELAAKFGDKYEQYIKETKRFWFF